MDELNLQSEEQQKSIQQKQDASPYDPNAADRFPDGYTPVGNVNINSPVEQVNPNRVPELEVTAPILDDIIPQDLYGYSGDNISFGNRDNPEVENIRIDSTTPVRNSNVVISSLPGNNIVPDSSNSSDGSNIQEPLVDPPTEPPVTPPDPPVEPPLPPVDPPEDPEEPEEPDPEDPEEPDPEEPEEPDPEDPEDPSKGNPGNDKEVGNSPWDGETGASDNPGKGNNQDGQDPEPNQPPGDSKNDGGQNNDPTDPPGNGGDNGNGGGKPDERQNNGWGNGDDDAPGNSLNHNNAENDQSPSKHYDDFVGRFLEENPVDVTYNWEQDNDSFLDYTPEFDPRFDHVPELPHFDNFDHPIDHFDHSM